MATKKKTKTTGGYVAVVDLVIDEVRVNAGDTWAPDESTTVDIDSLVELGALIPAGEEVKP